MKEQAKIKADDDVTDLGGKFVISGLTDSHQHFSLPSVSSGKNANPDFKCYRMMSGKKEDWGRTLNSSILCSKKQMKPDLTFICIQ